MTAQPPVSAMIDHILRYGGKCRECADNFGTCEHSGLPCDPDVARKTISHVLTAREHFIEYTRSNHKATPSDCDHYKMVSGGNGPWTCVACGAVDPPRPKYGQPAARPSVTSTDGDAEWLPTFKAFVDELDNHEAVTVNRDSVMHSVLRCAVAALAESNRSIFIEPQ